MEQAQQELKSAALGRHGKPTPFVQVTPGTHEPYFQAEKARMRAGAVSGSRAQVLSRRATITRTATGDRLMSYQDALATLPFVAAGCRSVVRVASAVRTRILAQRGCKLVPIPPRLHMRGIGSGMGR